MNVTGDTRGLDTSACDFAAGIAITQLNALPGDITKPHNERWQNEMLGSISLKFQAICETDPTFIPDVAKQLSAHADRLASVGQHISSGRLRGLLGTIIESTESL